MLRHRMDREKMDYAEAHRVASARVTALEEELHARPTRLAVLAERRREMEWRAAGNLDLLRHFEPYSRLLAVAGEAPSL